MSLFVDMDRYKRLGRVRRTFDDWLRSEGLIDRHCTRIDFTNEGYATITVLSVNDGQPEYTTEQVTLSSLPPKPVLDAIT